MTNNLSLIEQNRQLSLEVKRRINQMSAINAVAAVVGQSLDLDNTLETAMQVVSDVVGAEACGISLIDERRGEVVLRAQRGWMRDFVVNDPMRIPLGRGLSGQVIANDDVVVHNDLDGNEEYAVPSFREEHFRSLAMAPMHARGKIIGILSIMSSRAHSFDDDVISVLRVIADTVGVALSNARLYEASVEQEKRLSAVLHSTADGIIATDQDGRISLVNQMAERMLGIPRNELIHTPIRQAPIPQIIRDSLLAVLSERGADHAFEVQLENDRVISAVVSPIYVESQVEQVAETDGWVLVLQDVTHLREAEIARAEFIQAAAHDMRNPLSITLSSLNMLKKDSEQDDTSQEVIDLALGAVARLRTLIDDLLHLEQIESGYNFNLEHNDLLEVLHEVSKEVEPLMADKSISFSHQIPDELPWIMSDVVWIKRALHNYLENASKYTQSGGKAILKAYTYDNYLHLEVSDNGPGIPAKAQPKLFERFYRVEGMKGIRGSGLGLAIVKSVAEAHRGAVYVKSKKGEGSIFGLKLPLE